MSSLVRTIWCGETSENPSPTTTGASSFGCSVAVALEVRVFFGVATSGVSRIDVGVLVWTAIASDADWFDDASAVGVGAADASPSGRNARIPAANTPTQMTPATATRRPLILILYLELIAQR